MEQHWPDHLWIVRHGESAGNVARAAAMKRDRLVIDIADRDIDVPLSPTGERQAEALGRWFRAMRREQRPNAVLTSPYRRARRTAELVIEAGGVAEGAGRIIDERLREKELGALDRLTKRGIMERFPEEAEARRRLGKFYYRAPGGESWCDVILRLRSLLGSIAQSCRGTRLLVVCHQVVVLCLRYIIEGMTEDDILAIDRKGDVANASVTEYAYDPDRGRMKLLCYNFTVPLVAEGAPVTAEQPRRASLE